jgi:hypothetical protein
LWHCVSFSSRAHARESDFGCEGLGDIYVLVVYTDTHKVYWASKGTEAMRFAVQPSG